MGADGRLQEARDTRPERAGEAPAIDREEDVQERVHPAERRADPDREHRADDVLALAADVEQAAAERERDGEAREDERRRQDQRLLQVDGRHVALGAVESQGKNQLSPAPSKIARYVVERVAARGDEHHETADEEREERRQERCEEASGALGDA